MGSLAMFGGSFAPVHNGHVILALEVLELAALDRLVVVPARRSPLKPRDPLFLGDLRFDLLKRVFASVDRIDVSDIELNRAPPSFTLDTVCELKARYKPSDFAVVIGDDSVADLHRWHRIDDLLVEAHFLVARRPGSAAILHPSLARRARLTYLDTSEISISSTTVRARHQKGLSLLGFVPDPVREALLTLEPFPDAVS